LLESPERKRRVASCPSLAFGLAKTSNLQTSRIRGNDVIERLVRRHSGQAKREPEPRTLWHSLTALFLSSKFVENEHDDYDECDHSGAANLRSV
jgi:hypothetical protein